MPRHPQPNRYYYVQTEPVLLTDSHLDMASVRPAPIRLSKTWLSAFGFRPDSLGHSWVLNDVRLIPGTNCWLCVETRRYLRYVHELQDLFEEHFDLNLSLKINRNAASDINPGHRMRSSENFFTHR
ncbi:hypothetical protein ACO2Q8_01470 [Larkinella sp. VNQ87]|uniref:hypothetical protein n=1 Tax=Larkinella sp. VNQ87 TaxID=3400921 RepID=UPI003C030B52